MNWKRPLALTLAALSLGTTLAACSSNTETAATPTPAQTDATQQTADTVKVPKYVFLFVGDGMSYPQIQSTSDFLGALNDEDYWQAAPSLDDNGGAILDGLDETLVVVGLEPDHQLTKSNDLSHCREPPSQFQQTSCTDR